MPTSTRKRKRSLKTKRKSDIHSIPGREFSWAYVNKKKHPDYEEFKKILEKIKTQNKS